MKVSALDHLLDRSEAQWIDHHGWRVPAGFAPPQTEAEQVRRNAGLADLSYRVKYESTADPGNGAWRLSSRQFLTIGEPGLPQPERAVDVTSVYANLLLAGPRSLDIVGKLTSFNVSAQKLPNLAGGQASLAHVHAIVLREDLGAVPGFHILIGREYAESVWEAILHAGHEFHLVPFGLRALEMLRS